MKPDYLGKYAGHDAWVYHADNYNTDPLPDLFKPGNTQCGNQRFVMRIAHNGCRALQRVSNAKKGPFATVHIGFPLAPWNEHQSEEAVNRRAVEQGILTQADFDYFYG